MHKFLKIAALEASGLTVLLAKFYTILPGAAVLSFAALPFAAHGWEYHAQAPIVSHVASGTQTLSDRMIIGGEECVYKTGAGEWVLPYGILDVYWPFTVKVAGGAVQVGTGVDEGIDPGAFALTESITSKALLWVDAADPQPSHLAGSGDAVTTWYDRREGADVSRPSYFYAHADPALSTGGSPEKGMYDGRAGVYFGGVESKKCMPWYKPNGTLSGLVSGITHFFAVTGVSNTWGCIYGSTTGSASDWVTDAQTCADLSYKTTKYFWNNNWSYALNSRCFRNGERLDPLEDVQRGVQLIDTSSAETLRSRGTAGAYFTDRNMVYATGGDYLFEAICFTNALTEAEIGQVRAYLMRKWQIAGRKDARIRLAAGAELVVDTANGVMTNGANVAGAGRLVKKGANDLVYRNFGGVSIEGKENGAVHVHEGTRFDGEIDVRSGAVAMMSQAPVAASAGKCISNASAFGVQWPRLTVGAAASGALVKDGAGDVVIAGVPDGVQRLSVEEGFLGVRNVASASAVENGDVFEVTIANHSFEEETGEEFADGGIMVKKEGTHGWYSSSGDGVKIVHMSKWTGNCAAMDNATRAAWNFYSNPPDGDGALVINKGVYAQTDVTLPSAGWYEMSCRVAGREGYTRNDVFTVQLVGDEPVDLGRGLYYYSGLGGSAASPSGYQKVVMKAYVAAPGAYRLRINRPSVSNNATLIFDDFHLRRLADSAPDTVPIPGGTFETVELESTSTTLSDIQAFSPAAASVNGWTFAVPSGWTDSKSAAGIATPRTKGKWAQGEWYNDSRGPGHGFAEAFFRAPTTAVTSFTAAEAGTFRVQADLACFHSAGGSLQLAATVNGDTLDLGTLTPGHKILRTLQWPERLTLAAGDSVTLTFTFTRTGSDAGLWMDDVCLAGCCIPMEGNLVKDGGFEQGPDDKIGAGWTIPQGAVFKGRYNTSDKNEIAAFGQERIDGEKFAEFKGMKTNDEAKAPTFMYQDIVFPREGVYRLSFYSHCRLNVNSANHTCPTKWWLAADGQTNLIIRTANDTKGYSEHTADFYVPDAGTYRLGIEADQSSANGYEAMLDAVSITHVGDLMTTDCFNKEMRIDVAAGAKLGICFEGTRRIGSMFLGGRRTVGIIDAKSHPDYIVGTGAFEVVPQGLILSIR